MKKRFLNLNVTGKLFCITISEKRIIAINEADLRKKLGDIISYADEHGGIPAFRVSQINLSRKELTTLKNKIWRRLVLAYPSIVDHILEFLGKEINIMITEEEPTQEEDHPEEELGSEEEVVHEASDQDHSSRSQPRMVKQLLRQSD